MMTPARVLLVGDDRERLDVRASVLLHFWAVGVMELAGSSDVAGFSDLVVLCEAIGERARSEWIATVRARAGVSGPMGPLIVTMNGVDSGPRGGADKTVSTAGGPGALVSAIYELLTEKGLGSRSWFDQEAAGVLTVP